MRNKNICLAEKNQSKTYEYSYKMLMEMTTAFRNGIRQKN